MTLTGAPELRARLGALRGAARPLARELGSETVRNARGLVAVRTGRTRDSLRVGATTGTESQILGSGVAVILDRGARAHDIEPSSRDSLRFNVNGRTIFAKRVHHPRQPGSGFMRKAAAEAGKDTMAKTVVAAWNGAA